jgi:hypothetical protein
MAMDTNRNLSTPRVSEDSNERLRFYISDADAAAKDTARRKAQEWVATVTDLDTGIRYTLQGAPCGLDCYCDAIVIKTEAPA